jgi:hypothetical protein
MPLDVKPPTRRTAWEAGATLGGLLLILCALSEAASVQRLALAKFSEHGRRRREAAPPSPKANAERLLAEHPELARAGVNVFGLAAWLQQRQHGVRGNLNLSVTEVFDAEQVLRDWHRQRWHYGMERLRGSLAVTATALVPRMGLRARAPRSRRRTTRTAAARGDPDSEPEPPEHVAALAAALRERAREAAA